MNEERRKARKERRAERNDRRNEFDRRKEPERGRRKYFGTDRRYKEVRRDDDEKAHQQTSEENAAPLPSKEPPTPTPPEPVSSPVYLKGFQVVPPKALQPVRVWPTVRPFIMFLSYWLLLGFLLQFAYAFFSN